MNVKGFKDVSGNEFIAEVVSQSEDFMVIKNPLCFIPTERGVATVPYVFTSTGELTLYFSKLIFQPYKVAENVESKYREINSCVVVPQKELII